VNLGDKADAHTIRLPAAVNISAKLLRRSKR
jgi:hypothetical protein